MRNKERCNLNWGNKKVKVISLVLVMLCVVVLLIFNSSMTNSIGTRLKEIIGASSIETKIDYEIKELIGNKLEIYVIVKNEKGIENVTLNNDFEINCSSRKKIAFDRELEEGDILNIDVKLAGESNEENYTLIATTKPKIKLVNRDALGDETRKIVQVEYSKENEKVKNYYSLDNKETWIEYTKEIELENSQRENFWAKIEYEGRKTINKPVSYLESIDIIKFTDVTWKDGKARVGITSLNSEYIEYQVNSITGEWKKGTIVNDLNNNDIVYARINDGTSIIDTASITIIDTVSPARFSIEVTDIKGDNFKIKGSTQDSESGIASYTYVVAKKGEEIVDVSKITKEGSIQTNEQEYKNTGEQGYNINCVSNNNNSTNNTNRSSNKSSIWTKWLSSKSKTSK